MTNTIVLIVSSITVVMAWASLKMGDFGKFKMFQGITLVCALMFVGIKSVEYHDKFTHYEVQVKPGSVVKFKPEGKAEVELDFKEAGKLDGHLIKSETD